MISGRMKAGQNHERCPVHSRELDLGHNMSDHTGDELTEHGQKLSGCVFGV